MNILINKDHCKRYLLSLLLYILKFALEKRVNIESDKVNSCDFSVSEFVLLNTLAYFQHFSFKTKEMKQRSILLREKSSQY